MIANTTNVKTQTMRLVLISNHSPRLTTARAFTRIDFIVLIIVIGLCVTLLILTLARRRELVRRVHCQNNLTAISNACWMYADANHNDFPVAAHPEPLDDLTAAVDYTRAIGSYRGRADDPAAGNIANIQSPPTKLSTTRNLWLLVRSKNIMPKLFVCPSTQDRPNTDSQPTVYWDFGVGDITGPATSEQARQGYSQISYGYAVPYGKHGKPNSDNDHIVIVADKGPFGAAIESGRPAPPPFPTGSFTSFNQVADWEPWNSPNHGGDGQHIQKSGHGLEWIPVPTAFMPAVADNIYTRWAGKSTKPVSNSIFGQPPTASGRETASWDPTFATYDLDVLIYP